MSTKIESPTTPIAITSEKQEDKVIEAKMLDVHMLLQERVRVLRDYVRIQRGTQQATEEQWAESSKKISKDHKDTEQGFQTLQILSSAFSIFCTFLPMAAQQLPEDMSPTWNRLNSVSTTVAQFLKNTIPGREKGVALSSWGATQGQKIVDSGSNMRSQTLQLNNQSLVARSTQQSEVYRANTQAAQETTRAINDAQQTINQQDSRIMEEMCRVAASASAV